MFTTTNSRQIFGFILGTSLLCAMPFQQAQAIQKPCAAQENVPATLPAAAWSTLPGTAETAPDYLTLNSLGLATRFDRIAHDNDLVYYSTSRRPEIIKVRRNLLTEIIANYGTFQATRAQVSAACPAI